MNSDYTGTIERSSQRRIDPPEQKSSGHTQFTVILSIRSGGETTADEVRDWIYSAVDQFNSGKMGEMVLNRVQQHK